MQHFLKIGKLLENGTVKFESSKSSQVQNFEILNSYLNFEISKLLFATQFTFKFNPGRVGNLDRTPCAEDVPHAFPELVLRALHNPGQQRADALDEGLA